MSQIGGKKYPVLKAIHKCWCDLIWDTGREATGKMLKKGKTHH